MRSLNNPTPRFFTRVAFEFFSFFAPRANMQRKTKLGCKLFDFIAHVTGIQIQMLFALFRRPRPTNDNALNRAACEFYVMAIGAIRLDG